MGVFAGPENWWTDGTNDGRTHIASKGVVQDGLVLNLDSGSLSSYSGIGTEWNDLSGNSNNATLQNGASFSSDFGGIINLDGTDDYINGVHNAQLDITGDITVECWFKLTDSGSDWIRIFGKGDNTNRTFGLWYNSVTSYLLYQRYGSTNSNTFYYTNVRLDKWYHLLCTSSGSNHIIYLDGERKSNTKLGSTFYSSTEPYTIGNAITNTYQYGQVSNCRVYNRALSELEAKRNYNATRSRFNIPSLVSNGLIFDLDAANRTSYSGIGTTWYDLSSNSNNGIMNIEPGYSDGKITLNGIFNGITIPYNASLKPTTAITIEVFCYVENNGVNWISVIQYPQSSSSHTSPYFDWAIYLNMSDRRIHTRIDGESADSSTYVWNFNKWNHIVVTFENQSVKFYVNGLSAGTDTVTKTSIVYDNNNPVLIGKNASGSEYFRGEISKVSVYNRVLSEQEIRGNYYALKERFAASEIVQDGLVMYLDAGDTNSYSGSGTTWNNLVYNGNATLINGPTFSSNFGGNIVFDGTDDYASGVISNFNPNSGCTLECFVKRPTTPPAWRTYFNLKPNSGNVPFFEIRTSGAVVNAQVVYFNGTNYPTSAYDLSPSYFYHLVATYDGSGTIKFYINGSLVETKTSVASFAIGNNPTITIGRAYSNDRPTNIEMSTCNVYDRALTQSEVTQNYNAIRGRFFESDIITDGLVQYLDAGINSSYTSGSTWYDLSGSGNNATIVGTVPRTTDNGTLVLSLPGTTGNRIDASGPNLSNSNFTVMCATRCTSTQNGRIVSAGANNWLLGHHDDEAYKYYAGGWVNNPSLNNQNGQEWRIYCGTGDIAGDLYSLYVNGEHIVTNNGGVTGPNGWSIGRYYANDTQYTPAMIGFLICYDRVLNEFEIKQNFNALRWKFNL